MAPFSDSCCVAVFGWDSIVVEGWPSRFVLGLALGVGENVGLVETAEAPQTSRMRNLNTSSVSEPIIVMVMDYSPS